MKLIREKLFNPLHKYSICKNNLIKFRDGICNSGHCAMSFCLVWDLPIEKMMDGTRLSMRESIGVRSVRVLTSNNLKWQFLVLSFLPRDDDFFVHSYCDNRGWDKTKMKLLCEMLKTLTVMNNIVQMKGLVFW